MVNVKVYSGGTVSTKKVDEAQFGTEVLARTLKDAVVMYEANVRQGTVKTKTRSEVRGGNKKLWRQKHTGRARMGSKKVPHWRGGGVAFGPRPRDYYYQMPKKARRLALRNAIYTKFRDQEVAVADGWPTERPSTKTAFEILQRLEMDRSVLVVTDELNKTLYLSLRNVPYVDVKPVHELNAYQVLLRRYMILTPGALEQLQARFPGESGKNVEKKGS
ncbi:MAG: 50S ribosomal protein L4 [Planctomycetota bacterium]|jgi:large subunit ribosomal protein L4